jgi:hypothetical protein
MFTAVGLFEEPEYLYTQGSGCPFMFPLRRVKWRVQDVIAAAVARVLRKGTGQLGPGRRAPRTGRTTTRTLRP